MRKLTRRRFGQSIAGTGSALLPAAGQTPQPAKRPNILFICSDQHNARVMGWSGFPLAQTPNLDRLAATGVAFENAYCGSPVCVPARASLMTGMFPSDVGSYCNSTPFDGRVPTWGSRMRDSGYTCWATGKLDLVEGKDYGFEEFHTDHLHSSSPDITSLFRRPLCYRIDKRDQIRGEFRQRVRGDDQTVSDALRFLRQSERRADKPWVVYAGLVLPHPPFVAAEKYRNLVSVLNVPPPNVPPGHVANEHLAFRLLRDSYVFPQPIAEQDVRSARAAYLALVKELDDYLGQLLDQAGPDTLIVYTSDHGEMLGEHGLWFKNVLYEDSVRVPMILAGAGLPRGKRIGLPVSHADLAATLLDVAGIARPAGLRGHSLLPLLQGRVSGHPGYAYSESHSEGNCTGSFMIRKEHWKYLYFTWYGNLLFNLNDDPGEFHNLSGKPEYASIEKGLHAILTSLVNPDAVTEKAFEKQEQLLKTLASEKGFAKFREELASRLGEGQTRALVSRYRWQ